MSATVRRAWAALVAFVSAREDATSLACVRIAVGLTLAVHVARFSLSGAAAFDAVDTSLGGVGRPGPFGPLSPTAADALCIAVVACALLVAAGVLTRAAIASTWALFRVLIASVGLARGSYDALFVDTLVVLFFSGCGRALSVDALVLARDGHDREVARWPRMLLVLQLAMLYSGSAIAKLGSGWVPGGDASAIWFVLHDGIWARFGPPPAWTWHLTQIATTSVWLWELCSPVLVVAVLLRESAVDRAMKRLLDGAHVLELWLLFGVGMHAGIELLLRVGPFSYATLALYCAAIAPARIRRRLGVIGMRA